MEHHKPNNEALDLARHSMAHILAQAIMKVRPGTKLGFGPAIEDGFYYDFILPQPIGEADFKEIEKEMRKIIEANQKFEREELPKDAAVARLREMGQQFKIEYLEDLAKERNITSFSFYKNGPFIDMCEGPHVDTTKVIKRDCFKLDRIAGAYWRGSEKNPMMTRIYALMFETKEALDEFLKRRELAMQRDHKKLGSELDIFVIEEEVGVGLPLWMPNGTIIRDELEALAKEMEFKHGYKRVATPHITKGKLYEISGHLPYYKDSMFPPMTVDENEEYYLKPMNCPHHHLLFRARPKSYRELPYRIAEYGTDYRYEKSGQVSGLLRVRGMAMNDAHIYCMTEQVKDEFKKVLELHKFYYDLFRMGEFWIRLSFHSNDKPEKYVNNEEMWKYSEKIVSDIAQEIGIAYEVRTGEAAFYGPKIDFQVKNVIGREETASTTQLDFAMAERFNLEFTDASGNKQRPYIIHRAPLGTHERFIAFLIELYGGAFPTWLAPQQAIFIPVSEKFNEYCYKLANMMTDGFMRVEVDDSSDSFNKKIRNNTKRKCPNLLIVGGKEAEESLVTWRRYCTPDQKTMKFDDFHKIIRQMIDKRIMDNFADTIIPAI
ncbi:MAG TPA: threonine--tRNA ligase [Candidatus Wallbacteria bacterium]|nr:threonine--tRNA ligase [Candidatus Wallbacteria bacterium]